MTRRMRLGEMLVEAGVIDPASLTAALAHQRQWGVRLGQALVELRIVTERDIVHALSRKLGLDVAVVDGLSGKEFDAALRLVPREFAVKHNVLPMSDDGNTLSVAMSDPVNVTVIDDLAFRSGRRVKVTIGGDQEIGAALKRHYPAVTEKVEAIAFEDDPSDAGIMPLVGQEHAVHGDSADAEWRSRELSRDRRAQSFQPHRRTPPPEHAARRDLLGSVPATGFELEKTAEMALTGDYPLGQDGEPELLPADALEPMSEPPGLELPGRPVEARPEPAQQAPLPARAAQVVARLAARGADDAELADAARVLAAVLRVLAAKALVSDEEIAAELRRLSGEQDAPGGGQPSTPERA
jgi:type IV pilus assembly protein PilB